MTTMSIKNIEDFNKIFDYPDDFTGTYEIMDDPLSTLYFVKGMAITDKSFYDQYNQLIGMGYPEKTAYKLIIEYNSATFNYSFAKLKESQKEILQRQYEGSRTSKYMRQKLKQFTKQFT